MRLYFVFEKENFIFKIQKIKYTKIVLVDRHPLHVHKG